MFNTRGYGSGSMSELMELTGLKKGGIYNHIGSKEELAVEAFNYSIRLMNKKVAEVMQGGGETVTAKLRSLLEFYNHFGNETTFEGGCPMLNTAVESDNGHPELARRVREVLQEWRQSLCNLIGKGVSLGEFRADANPMELATIILSSIEGGVMLSRALDDRQVMVTVSDNLWRHLERELLA